MDPQTWNDADVRTLQIYLLRNSPGYLIPQRLRQKQDDGFLSPRFRRI